MMVIAFDYAINAVFLVDAVPFEVIISHRAPVFGTKNEKRFDGSVNFPRVFIEKKNPRADGKFIVQLYMWSAR